MTDPTTQNSYLFKTIGIIGVGLLGGSIAAAARQRKLTGKILGAGRNPARMRAAQHSGLLDRGTTNIAETSAESDLIIVCTPVNQITQFVRTVAQNSRPGTLITDVGSTKQKICEALYGSLPEGVTFVASHPLAGSEKTGFEFADPNLFQGRPCVITPDDSLSEEAVSRIKQFWEALGMHVLETSPQKHDQILAETSHLPHVVASALAMTLTEENRNFTSTGFRDTTRIAAGDPALWIEILLNNREAVVESIDRYTHSLGGLREAIVNHDENQLRQLLEDGKKNHDALNSSRTQ
ncbi:MAG: prephenate dehydrogenase [Planctomycetes bacterium]|nr:prephenate dehydrogenase [Planctomycetota bacterium]MCH9777356.1 prephenate dehydrogenase [Planctomycetota bacterium]MCH9792321.1 prephenate dehydrogenase [Planctomycetota bacterium]